MKVFENIIKIKLPKHIEIIFKRNPQTKPKKNPELSKIIIPPGNEKVKYNVEIIKNTQNEKI